MWRCVNSVSPFVEVMHLNCLLNSQLMTANSDAGLHLLGPSTMCAFVRKWKNNKSTSKNKGVTMLKIKVSAFLKCSARAHWGKGVA